MLRLLCDQHVPTSFLTAFDAEPWLDVVTVREELAADADDTAIAAHAASTGRVVFTNDDDFFQHRLGHGLILYEQTPQPAPSEVVAALEAIHGAYDDHSEVVEYVPDGWV